MKLYKMEKKKNEYWDLVPEETQMTWTSLKSDHYVLQKEDKSLSVSDVTNDQALNCLQINILAA